MLTQSPPRCLIGRTAPYPTSPARHRRHAAYLLVLRRVRFRARTRPLAALLVEAIRRRITAAAAATPRSTASVLGLQGGLPKPANHVRHAQPPAAAVPILVPLLGAVLLVVVGGVGSILRDHSLRVLVPRPLTRCLALLRGI